MNSELITALLWAATLLVIAYFSYIQGLHEYERIEGYVHTECGNTLPAPSPSTYAYCESLGCTCPTYIQDWTKVYIPPSPDSNGVIP